MPMQCVYKQEPQRSHMVLDCSRVQLPCLEQVSLVTPNMIGTELDRVTCRNAVRTARRSADSAASCPLSSCDARALRASSCEGGSQLDTSSDSHPIPASKLLASHCRSDRGACGFVLVAQPEVTRILPFTKTALSRVLV